MFSMKFAIVWPDQIMPVAPDGKHEGRQFSGIFVRCMSPLLALSRHRRFMLNMSAFGGKADLS
jgi:hypothetical protein